jgi:hypothetical protein
LIQILLESAAKPRERSKRWWMKVAEVFRHAPL